jgi:predicted amidophosphoribosyltransferase
LPQKIEPSVTLCSYCDEKIDFEIDCPNFEIGLRYKKADVLRPKDENHDQITCSIDYRDVSAAVIRLFQFL